MVPHCPILSTKLKRLVAEQVSFTLSAANFFLVTAQQPPAYPTSFQYEIILPNLEQLTLSYLRNWSKG